MTHGARGRCAALLLVVAAAWPASAWSQAFEISNGTDNTCAGAFLDSGGQGGTGYGNNENYTYTLCPDNPGDAISVDFITFQLSTAGPAPIDNLVIHDGNSTSAPLIGTYTGTQLQGQVVSASPGNSSGCLTFVWTSNSTGTGVFAGSITCYVPCVRPVAAASMVPAAPAMICPGESVSFNGSASTAAAGFSIASHTWDWDDGTTSTSAGPNATHTFNAPGEYVVQLVVEDNNGCASVNLLDLQVLVGTEPTFTGTLADPGTCVGTPVCLEGVVNATTWNAQPTVDFGGGVALPDNVGSCFTSQLQFSGFAPGATLTNVNQLQSICIDIEHSFLGDLVISIISPSGETVVLHQQGGLGTYLGVPVDNELTPNAVGTCWTYCFSPSATNGTMAANAGVTLPAGTYESVDPLSGLLGAQLNGMWTIEICDLWTFDNGFLCGWSMAFDPGLFGTLTEFTPTYGAACDSTWWTGPDIVSSTGDCEEICVQPPAPGSYDYVYHATDNFGCTYDTTVSITVHPPPTVNAGADATICAGQGPVQLGATASGGAPTSACTYVLQMLDSFGDGWNGASVTITINGVPATYTLNNGANGTLNLPVQTGDVITIAFSSGTYDNEITYRLRNGSNAIVFQDGPSPTIGQAWTGVVDCGSVPVTYGYSWSPTTGLSDPNIANPTANPGSTTTYTVTVTQNGQPGCVGTDQVTVTVVDLPDPGTTGSITLCSTDAPADLFTLLGGTPDVGGAWSGPSTLNGSSFDPGTMLAGVYTYTVNGVAPCPSASADVTVAVNTPPDPGTTGSITLCSTDAPADLFTLLGGTPDAGGAWSGPSALNGSSFDPGSMLAGVYTYTVNGVAPCPSASADVTVAVNTPPDPGTTGSITLCSTDAPADLFALLGGTPDAGGAWSGPGTLNGSSFDPGIMLAGVYTYTVTGVAPCPSASADVTVAVNTPPDPGTTGSITLCSTDLSADLFTLLGGTPDAGGAWSGPSTLNGSSFDPGIMLAGVYTYTVNGVAPCPSASADVTVAVNTPPDPGTTGSITLCSTDLSADLFTLLGGTPDAGGAWSGPSTLNGSSFDPGSMLAGVYTYTVNGVAPCPSASADVTVAVNTPPDPGTTGSITLCSTDAPADLFALLGGTPDAGGAWSGPGTLNGSSFDPGSMLAGGYTYTVNGVAPCPSASVDVTVVVNTLPDAGLDGGLTLCASSAAVPLLSGLNGTPDAGGSWTGPGGAVIGGLFTPGLDPTGTYIYTVNGLAPCPSASATVDVIVATDPDPGTPGAITLCTNDAAALLFTHLGGTPDAGGSWSGPSPVLGGLFDPGTMLAGVYTYTITVPPPCTSASSTVTVALSTPPDPGTNGALLLCATSPATALVSGLGGSPNAGGAWSGPSPVVGGLFDPAGMTPGTYTYSVAGTAPCPAASALVDVTVVANPNAGTPSSITLCTSDAPVDLFAQLGGTPDAGGSWSGPSPVVGGLFDPGTMLAGVYTYTITVPPPCTSASSTVTVTLSTPPDPGTDGALLLCATSPATALISGLGGSPNAGGAWSGPSPVVGGLFDPAGMTPGTYTYTVAGTAPCPAASALVDVTVVANPNAGTPGAITLCTSDAPVDLFAQLGGTADAGGTWSGPSTLNGSSFDPGTMLAGVYTYTITVPPPCTSASSTVTVALNTPPDPGIDGALLLCATSPATALLSGLGGSPDAGGAWSGPSPVVGGLFDPAGMTPGTYSYTVAGTAPCPSESAVVEVTVVANPDAGTPGAITLCTSDAPVDLFAQLGGTPDAGGTWSGPSTLNGSSFDPGTMLAGVYTYTITVPPPCTSASSTVTVALNTPPDPGTDGALLLCATSPATALISGLGGTPDAGGAWSGPSPVVGGLFDPAGMTPGTYTYTVAGTAPCPAATALVDVTVVANPNAGTPGAITLCTSDAPVDLFAQLGGTPDAGGTWSGPSTLNGSGFDPGTMLAGVYTYTITVPPPCSNASSTVTVTLSTPPDPGTDGVLTVCAISGTAALITALGGSPDPGGSWTDPNGDPHSGLFDPQLDPIGAYTYTVGGIAPCPALSASATVLVQAAPFAGTPAVLNLCASGSPVDLFPTLGGADPGGTWTDPNGTVFTDPFDPTADLSGTYTYTLAGTPPCPSASATVEVHLLTDPDAGSDASITLCSTGVPLDLFGQLGGAPDAGGLWLDPQGQPVGSTFDPATATVGAYTYVLVVPAPCVNDTAQVLVAVVQAVDAGLDGALLVCANDAPTPLFNQLGGTPDAGGTWTDPMNQPWTGPFDPASHPAGTYTYQVNGTAPCPNDDATVLVTVEALPDAGTDGSTTICPEAAPVDLFSLLGGSPDGGGTWADPYGQPSNGWFDPATDPQGGYTYTVFGQGACSNASASATVSLFVLAPPDAGPDLVACDLMAPLNASGSWSTGQWLAEDSAEVLDATAAATMAKAPGSGAYAFIWSVLSTDGCAMADTVVITFTTPISALAQTTDAICHGACDGTAVIQASGGNGPLTFQWTPAVSGTAVADSFNAQGLCAGPYTVSVLDTNACSTPLTLTISEPLPLVIDAVLATPETCPGTCDGALQVVDPEGALFSFDGGVTWQPAATMSGLCSGPYAVMMMSANGCLAASPALLIPPAPVVADFVAQPDTVLVSDPTVVFTNQSDNASWFTWDFAGLGTSTLQDPSFTFPDVLGGTYTVCLTAVNGNGCVDSVCHPVVVLDLLAVHVPNAFTPNGDGINDDFMPVFNEPSLLTEYSFMVFDRWGELIWESTVPHEPWNGDYHGEAVQQEVYTWRLIYKDGRSFRKEAVMGHVTVLK